MVDIQIKDMLGYLLYDKKHFLNAGGRSGAGSGRYGFMHTCNKEAADDYNIDYDATWRQI